MDINDAGQDSADMSLSALIDSGTSVSWTVCTSSLTVKSLPSSFIVSIKLRTSVVCHWICCGWRWRRCLCIVSTHTVLSFSCQSHTDHVTRSQQLYQQACNRRQQLRPSAAIWRTRRNITSDSGPLAPSCENNVIHKPGSTSKWLTSIALSLEEDRATYRKWCEVGLCF